MVVENAGTVSSRVRSLHAIRVAGWVDAERLGVWEVSVDVADDPGALKRVSTPRGEMVGLTEQGAEAAVAELAALVAALDADTVRAMAEHRSDFEGADATMKAVVSAFQRSRTPEAAAALAEFHATVADLLDAIAASFPLWRTYADRLAAAVREVEHGDTDFVASPLLESYHTVWHLLHRDMRLVQEQIRAAF